MSRLGITNLPKAPKKRRPSRVLLKGKVKHPFETKEEVVQEALIRAKLLRQSADQHPSKAIAQLKRASGDTLLTALP